MFKKRGSKGKNLKGEIGFCKNADLGFKQVPGGHYVYIREVDNDKCKVNVITSLEDRAGKFKETKLKKVRKGYVYPIPKNDANFSLWSGVKDSVITVVSDKITYVGERRIKRRHKFFIGKFLK